MSLLLVFVTSVATVTGEPATLAATALDAQAVPGVASTTGAVATATATALDGTATLGTATATGAVAEAIATALDATAIPGPVSTTGGQATLTATALDGVAIPGAVSLTGEAGTLAATALDGSAVPGPVTTTGAVSVLAATALDGVAGYPAPRASVLTLSVSLPRRSLSCALPVRELAVSLPRRTVTVSLPVRTLSCALPRRFLVSSVHSFTKGDIATPAFTLTVDSGVIAEPQSIAVELYRVGSTTLVTSLAVLPASCTGWTTSSVVVPVTFVPANTPDAAQYNVEIVGTYVDGKRRWPEGREVAPGRIGINLPGAR
jgi:hypothetical protein